MNDLSESDGVFLDKAAVNHLRRLIGWMRCEVGPTPDEVKCMVRDIAQKLDHPEISVEAETRLVNAYLRAESIPLYIRDAIKALEKRIGE